MKSLANSFKRIECMHAQMNFPPVVTRTAFPQRTLPGFEWRIKFTDDIQSVHSPISINVPNELLQIPRTVCSYSRHLSNLRQHERRWEWRKPSLIKANESLKYEIFNFEHPWEIWLGINVSYFRQFQAWGTKCCRKIQNHVKSINREKSHFKVGSF